MATKSDTESVERIIPAPPEAIFALIADARRHKDLDGSGTVRDAKNMPEQLVLGSTFGMGMRMGIPYSTVNTVIEFEPNQLIAWQTYAPGPFAKLIGGRIWRYQLEAVDGGTKVTETWDISQERHKKPMETMRPKAIAGMTATLERIETLVAAGS